MRWIYIASNWKQSSLVDTALSTKTQAQIDLAKNLTYTISKTFILILQMKSYAIFHRQLSCFHLNLHSNYVDGCIKIQ
jgi:hypothetical protein